MNLLLGLAFVFILIIYIYMKIKGKRKNTQSANERLEEMLGLNDENRADVILTKKEQKIKNLEVLLIRAGIPLNAKEFIKIRWAICIVIIILFTIAMKNPLFGIIIAGGAFFLPMLFVNYSINKKKAVFEAQLPVALSVIQNSVEAGFSFLQAMDVVAKEMDAPISEEFSRVLHEASVGKDIEIALHNMYERVLSEELKLVITAVLIQRQVGGNLAEIIEVILETIKDRIQIKGEIKTLTAQGRMSAIIISALPFFLGVIMYMINPVYMTPLFTTFIGQVLMAFALVWMGIGVYFMMKIVTIEF